MMKNTVTVAPSAQPVPVPAQPAAAIPMKRVAVITPEGRLVGERSVAASAVVDSPTLIDIDPGDLPLDGSYKWMADRQHFTPMGTGFGKVLNAVAPYSVEFVLSDMIDAFEKIDERVRPALPQSAKEWRDWFASDLKRREAEQLLGRTKL